MGTLWALFSESCDRELSVDYLVSPIEYLLAENRIFRAHLPGRLRLTDPERRTLAEIAKRVGRKTMKDLAQVAKPDTILGWFHRLVAAKFDGSAHRRYPGRPRVSAEVEELVVRSRATNVVGDTTASWVP